METEYVINSYNKIADHFDKTRVVHWKAVKDFIMSLTPNNSLLDAGCGNGKNMQIRTDINCIGVDTSEKLIEICKNKNLNVIMADIRNLPFHTNTFDKMTCIAVIHHLSTNESRLNALKELVRVLKHGGELMFQVWAREQKLDKKFIAINDKNDYFVTWNDKNNDSITKRYYHLFTEEDIDNLVLQVSNIKIISKLFEKDNWCFIIKKI